MFFVALETILIAKLGELKFLKNLNLLFIIRTILMKFNSILVIHVGVKSKLSWNFQNQELEFSYFDILLHF